MAQVSSGNQPDPSFDFQYVTRARWRAAACLTPVLVLLGCSSSGGSGRDALLDLAVPAARTITTAQVAGLGTVLTDADGHTLYMFPPDARSQVRCTGSCAGTWPPVVIAAGHTPTAAGGLRSTLLGTIADPNSGARIVTYNRYPLYRYAGDVARGSANGQALFNSGGPWYALAPTGVPITAAVR